MFDRNPSTKVVCEGYSKAFQFLCDLTDFQGDVVCYSVTGDCGGPHMWNVVAMDGANYLVDLTNCDGATSIGYPEYLYMKNAGPQEDGRVHVFQSNSGDDVIYTYDEDQANLYCDGYLTLEPKEDTVISVITVSDLDVPKAFGEPDTTATLSEGLQAVTVDWDPEVNEGFRFIEDKYNAKITYTVMDGYVLAENPTVETPEGARSASIDTENCIITVDYPAIERDRTDISIWIEGQNEVRPPYNVPVPYAKPGEITTITLNFQLRIWFNDGQNSTTSSGSGAECWTFEMPENVSQVTQEENKTNIRISNTAPSCEIKVRYQDEGYTPEEGRGTADCVVHIVKEEPVITYLNVAARKTGITLPTAEEGPLEFDGEYEITAYDQYGQLYSGAEELVEWSVEHEGVTIDPETGMLTIQPGAATGNITVTAAFGEVSATTIVSLNKKDASAGSISIEGEDSVEVLPMIVDGFGNPSPQAAREQYRAVLTDLYGDPYGGNVVWSIEGGTVTGVQISERGLLTVTTEAEVDSVTIRATCEGLSVTKTIMLTRSEARKTAWVEIDGPDVIVAGHTGQWVAKTYDQYGDEVDDVVE